MRLLGNNYICPEVVVNTTTKLINIGLDTGLAGSVIIT